MRSRNGHTDNGRNLSPKKRCPNCNSTSYIETLSRESCSSCGLSCDYWGGGSNAVYDNMMAIRHRCEEEEQAEELQRAAEEYRDSEW